MPNLEPALKLVGMPNEILRATLPEAMVESMTETRPRIEASPELAAWLDTSRSRAGVSIGPRRRGRLRLRLRPETPPGEYTASVSHGELQQQILVTVHARVLATVQPHVLLWSGLPGTRARVEIVLTNAGNVPLEVPESCVTGIFDDKGIEAAFASTYRQETDDLNQLAGHLLSKLRESHGGLFKVHIAGGARNLAPGELCNLTLQTTLASKLLPGHSYHGLLPLTGGLQLSMQIQIGEPPK